MLTREQHRLGARITAHELQPRGGRLNASAEAFPVLSDRFDPGRDREIAGVRTRSPRALRLLDQPLATACRRWASRTKRCG